MRAKHAVVITRLAADLVFSGSVKCPCGAAAVVQFLGAMALGRGTKRARGTNDGACRTVLSNLAWLAAEGVRRVVSRSADDALAATQ